MKEVSLYILVLLLVTIPFFVIIFFVEALPENKAKWPPHVMALELDNRDEALKYAEQRIADLEKALSDCRRNK